VRNALNLQMIREITRSIEELNSDPEIRLIIFRSEESYFCAGADLAWMQAGVKLSKDQLIKEGLEFARLFRVIHESAAITISAVRGRVPGGAVGLLAASDFVVAEAPVTLSFPELKLGLIPAVIGPYVLRKAGYSRTSDWMMTGRPVGAAEARQAGLIHRICEEGRLGECTEALVDELLSGGEQALRGVKPYLRRLETLIEPDEVDLYTSKILAGYRVSPEAQEGMKAFLEKTNRKRNETH
jgi:methylglutaconyl-CoA hydratase